MTKRAAIYARVNTVKQIESKYSLEGQIESCKQFAAENGFNVVDIFQDEISGKTRFIDRPAGLKLYLAIEVGLVDIVIVDRVYRLSRDVLDYVTTVQAWSQEGVEIYVLDVGRVTTEFGIRKDILKAINDYG